MSTHFQDPIPVGSGGLSIALIGPNDARRRMVAGALGGSDVSVREFVAYPNKLGDVPRLMEQNYDVVIIDLDSDQNYALELVETLAAANTSTVMVYSMNNDPNLLMSCMRAGAREFLAQPIAPAALSDALSRAAARRPAAKTGKTGGGKVLVFLGGKGGSGVT